MALPYDYTRTVDTLFSIAADTISGDPINLINQGGEKLLPELAAKGRIFMFKYSNQVSHPVMHSDGGGVIRDYLPGKITGATGGHGLDNVAAEILSHAKFDMVAGSRNISFPQDMPDGNQLDYMVNLLKSSAISLFNREESLLVSGGTDGGATVASNACTVGDAKFITTDVDGVKPMSLLGLMAAGTETSGDGTGIDESAESFAGISVNDAANWAPQTLLNPGGANANINATELEAALQTLILQCTFSGVEAPDTILMGTTAYDKLLAGFRGRMAPTHLMEDSVYGNEFFMLGGCKVLRHRMLEYSDNSWDLRQGDSATWPVLVLNLKSLRMNIVKQDMSIGEGFGFLSSPVEGVFPHPESTNLFKRVGWKRSYSLDNGRRSFGAIIDIADFD